MNRRRFFLGHDRPASLMDKNLDMAERRRFVFLNMVVFMHLRKALHHLQMFPILLIGVDDVNSKIKITKKVGIIITSFGNEKLS